MQCEEAAHCSFDIFQISVMRGVLCNSVTVARCSFTQLGGGGTMHTFMSIR